MRDAGIDVLRGLSVLLVVAASHVNLRFALNHYDVAKLLPKPLARVVFWSGYYAVIVFFVISGFLITSLSLRRWSSLGRIDARAFYWMRFARIVPCLVALLLVLSVLHLAGAHDYVIDPCARSLPRAIVAALTFHFNWLEGTRGYLPGSWDVLWSLSIEEAFYVVFPLVCLSCGASRCSRSAARADSDRSRSCRVWTRRTSSRGTNTRISRAWTASRSVASRR